MKDSAAIRLRVQALGSSVTLEVHGAELATAVVAAWHDALAHGDGDGDSRPITVAVGPWDSSDVSGRDIAEVLHLLSPAVTQRAIASRAGQLVMLHAAALADVESGATAVLVAPSGTGKTTAAATLGRHFAYLTDETAGVDRDGKVVPYRKPLSIIRSGHVKDQVSPKQLGLLTTSRVCHVAALVVIARNPDHTGQPTVTSLETVDALAALAPEASSLGRLGLPLQRLADIVHRAGGAHRVDYSEAHTLEPVIRSLLDGARR